jgi:uncharacterized protein YceH (UPF0502 family)
MSEKFKRDPRSGGIVLTDRNTYDMARKAREARRKRHQDSLSQQKKNNSTEQTLINFEMRVSALEKDLAELKQRFQDYLRPTI